MTCIGKENRSSHFVSEKKTEAVNAYLIKNSKGGGGGGGGGGHSHRQSEGLGGVAWVYKIGLK